jgi:hypothetical protein
MYDIVNWYWFGFGLVLPHSELVLVWAWFGVLVRFGLSPEVLHQGCKITIELSL